jgi:hypothetical protein
VLVSPFFKGVLPPFGPVRCKLVVTLHRSCALKICVTVDYQRQLPASMRSLVSIPLLVRAMLLIGIATLTLFAVGPLAGSVDDDGDGSPDIPVVVSDLVFFTDQSADRHVDRVSGNIQHGASPGHLRSSTPDIPIIYSQFLSMDAGCILSSHRFLRC